MSDGITDADPDRAPYTRQCDAVAVTKQYKNCCVLRDGHEGKHQNADGYEFTRVWDRKNEQNDEIAALHECDKHPRYRAIRKPRTACEGCWRCYVLVHPDLSLETRWLQ